LPNHERNAKYALPNAGARVPDASTATAGDDPTVAQTYDFTIPLTPTKAASPNSARLGVIGLMISGRVPVQPLRGRQHRRGALASMTALSTMAGMGGLPPA
jgi:hypothetical protein